MHRYLARKAAESREISQLLRGAGNLNHRQLTVLQDALEDPELILTISGQANRHRVTNQSARTDLLDLERHGLLIKERVGKRFEFRPVPDVSDRLRRLAAS